MITIEILCLKTSTGEIPQNWGLQELYQSSQIQIYAVIVNIEGRNFRSLARKVGSNRQIQERIYQMWVQDHTITFQEKRVHKQVLGKHLENLH